MYDLALACRIAALLSSLTVAAAHPRHDSNPTKVVPRARLATSLPLKRSMRNGTASHHRARNRTTALGIGSGGGLSIEWVVRENAYGTLATVMITLLSAMVYTYDKYCETLPKELVNDAAWGLLDWDWDPDITARSMKGFEDEYRKVGKEYFCKTLKPEIEKIKEQRTAPLPTESRIFVDRYMRDLRQCEKKLANRTHPEQTTGSTRSTRSMKASATLATRSSGLA